MVMDLAFEKAVLSALEPFAFSITLLNIYTWPYAQPGHLGHGEQNRTTQEGSVSTFSRGFFFPSKYLLASHWSRPPSRALVYTRTQRK